MDEVENDQTGRPAEACRELFAAVKEAGTGLEAELFAKIGEISRLIKDQAKLTVVKHSADRLAQTAARKLAKEEAKKRVEEEQAAEAKALKQEIIDLRIKFHTKTLGLEANNRNDAKTIYELQQGVVPGKKRQVHKWQEPNSHITRSDTDKTAAELRIDFHDFSTRLAQAKKDEVFFGERLARLAALQGNGANLSVMERWVAYHKDLARRMDISLTKCVEVISRRG